MVPDATNSDLSELQCTQSTSAQKPYALIVKDHPNPTTNSSPCSQNYERKFNLVTHGLKESDQGTSRSSRIKRDNELVLSTLTTVDPSIAPHCVRDCVRLGKLVIQKIDVY